MTESTLRQGDCQGDCQGDYQGGCQCGGVRYRLTAAPLQLFVMQAQYCITIIIERMCFAQNLHLC